MEEKDIRRKNIKTMLIAVIIMIAFFGVNIIENMIDAKKEQEKSMQTALVTDNSRYFTVLNCAKKFISYVQKGTNSDILTLFNEEYKTSNGIIESNVKGFVPSLNNGMIYDYVGEEMYFKRISKNVTEYYLNGKLKSFMMDETPSYIDYDMTIILYEDKFLFSIKPGIEGLDI